MFSCLIGFLVAVLIAVIVLWILELGAGALGVSPPPQVWMIVRLIVALIVLLMGLQCLLGGTGGFTFGKFCP